MFVWRFPTFGVLGPYHTPVRSSLWKCLFCKQIRCTIYRNLVGWIPCHLPFWTPLVENAKFVEHLVDKFLSIWLKSNYVGLRTFHWCQVVKCWCFGGWFDPPPPWRCNFCLVNFRIWIPTPFWVHNTWPKILFMVYTNLYYICLKQRNNMKWSDHFLLKMLIRVAPTSKCPWIPLSSTAGKKWSFWRPCLAV